MRILRQLLFLTNSTALAQFRHHPEINQATNKAPNSPKRGI